MNKTLPLFTFISTICLFVTLQYTALAQTYSYTTAGLHTFSVPSGVTTIQAEAWGGGGKGGSKSSGNSTYGGGGGGAYARKAIAVSNGTTYNLSVGAGSSIATSPGGDSWVIDNSTLLAKGGNTVPNNGTTGATGGSSATSIGDFTLSGGNGANGGTNGGGGGSSAGTLLAGTSALSQTGAIAPSGGGNGGNGAAAGSAAAGVNPGGGGGGGKNNDNGAFGASGKVTLTWLCPSYLLLSTTAGAPICAGASSTITVLGLALNLPSGNYTVTYNLSGANSATGLTATMAVNLLGSGSFSTAALNNAGATTLTITNLSSGVSPTICSAPLSLNNVANITVNAVPTITSTTAGSTIGPGLVTLSATASAGTISWFSAPSGGSALGVGPTFITPLINTTSTYYVETSTLSCTSPTRVAVTATVAEPEISITGNSVAISDGDLTPTTADWTSFGSMEISTGIITKTFTISNTGNAPLLIGAISFSGPNAADFSVNTSPSLIIASGASSAFSISFNPSTLGIKNATLSIANNDSNENPFDFAIQGIGIQSFFDSDGDGVFDNFDIDDDNDGITDITEENNCNSSNGSKVDYKFLNETFGTGGRTANFTAIYNATTTYCYEDGIVGANTTACPSQSSKILDDGEYTVVSKITGTVASDPENIHGDLAWYNGEDHTPGDTNGRMAVFNASFTPGTFYETTITGILSNLPITYSFWALNIMAANTYPGSILPNITVEFYDLSNNLLNTFNTGDIGRCSSNVLDNSCTQGQWMQFSTSVNLGNVNAFTIRFKNNAPGGGGNDLALDDILISQTLCDRDGDSVADLFDLDSDNDGLEDVIEIGLGSLSNGKGKIDAAWVDINANGLHDLAEPIAALPTLDSDGDGGPNYLDLDSDNDSIFDVDESGAGNVNAVLGFENGDGDINGDGVGDGLETESFRNKDMNGDGTTEGFGDGILDIYDYGTGINQYGNLGQGSLLAPFLDFLLDTNGNGIPNYLDVKSNGITFDISHTAVLYPNKILDANNNGIIDGGADIDKDGILDAFDTNTAVFGSPRDINTKLFLNFDGRNDFIQSSSLLGGLSGATLMCWIDINPSFSAEGILLGQDKFHLKIDASRKLVVTLNGQSIQTSVSLNTSQWYHVGAVFNGNSLKLFLNGNVVGVLAISGSIAPDLSIFTVGKNPLLNTQFFRGKIDEIRVFGKALTDVQLQRMVYQEIQSVGSQIQGTVIPKNIASGSELLGITDMLHYFRMDTYKDDVVDDLTTVGIDLIGAKLFNFKNMNVQEAPMPFLTERNGDFSIAANSPTKEIRGQDIMDQDWSIVHVRHDVTESANTIDLGMIVDAGKVVTVTNDSKLQNDWYLVLNGKIDLVGMSQLVQTAESDLAPTSTGFIERDQQGQTNLYNYNYWSSPVSPINATTNNTDYSVKSVFKDGTNPANPVEINWIDGLNSSPTAPLSVTRYWLYKFENNASAYANWIKITENSPLRVGQGFTLKGSGAGTALQNYTFVGKPNNGTITTNTVSANQLLLTGNPYPSALNAYQFITDNITTIDNFENTGINGTLYLWEHASNNNSHYLKDYLGGYAVLNLSGGLPPVVPTLIAGVGLSNKIPKQFIPVGQGFFVYGKNGGGGTVNFNNGQRAFQKETAAVSTTLFKTKNNSKNTTAAPNNNNDSVPIDTFKRVRLGLNTASGYHRQLLLAFMEDKATDGFDFGYDGMIMDNFPADMYFLQGTNPLVIQGVGRFDTTASYPLGIKTDREGPVTFLLDGTENFDNQQMMFIHDMSNNTYHNIQNGSFTVNLPQGKIENRFVLTFADKTLGTNEQEIENNQIIVIHSRSKSQLEITNTTIDNSVETVKMYSILGQIIAEWDAKEKGVQQGILPIKSVTPGVYVVSVKTTKGQLNKKIIIP